LSPIKKTVFADGQIPLVLSTPRVIHPGCVRSLLLLQLGNFSTEFRQSS
jgi:hypothetical protein